MIGLEQSNTSYLILSAINDMVSILYAKDYQLVPIKGYYRGQYEDLVIAFGKDDNDELRKDILFLLDHCKHDSAIIKYTGETNAKRILKDGSEDLLCLDMYNTDSDRLSYLYEGYSFSFIEAVRYWKPTKKEDFKVGMIVEYLNNNKWYEKKIENPSDEYEKLYKLLVKYDKVRIASK